ncbi:lipase [Catellatospora sp. IY07-71]|uniref:alpha/beta hydrolase family protein n=1 Tax=Catellatospora sp. IY07-71 TaxID=2728827 RepID=UPI001BB39C4D|nr:alpha/beta hydrolase [Catellatospora sp. IY07-71]BCJ75085.1 lipase [Catellatospora sp. IY07-71]
MTVLIPLRRRLARLAYTTALTIGMVSTSIAGAAPAAYADQIGQNPTSLNITGNGSFATTSASISSLVSGFGGGRVYYPTATGTYPLIAISPGYTATWSSISWLGPRLASWGFVVVGIETNTLLDQPASRGQQLLAALNWAVSSSAPSAVRSRADTQRWGVAGHSMGGGGTLEALAADTSGRVKVGVPIAPWNLDKTWSGITEPVAIVGGQTDAIAGVSTHSIPFYNSLSGPKAYLELQGEGHFFPQTTDSELSKMIVSWFKRFLSQDTRFSSFVCFSTFGDLQVSDFRNNVGC